MLFWAFLTSGWTFSFFSGVYREPMREPKARHDSVDFPSQKLPSAECERCLCIYLCMS